MNNELTIKLLFENQNLVFVYLCKEAHLSQCSLYIGRPVSSVVVQTFSPLRPGSEPNFSVLVYVRRYNGRPLLLQLFPAVIRLPSTLIHPPPLKKNLQIQIKDIIGNTLSNFHRLSWHLPLIKPNSINHSFYKYMQVIIKYHHFQNVLCYEHCLSS